MSDPIYKRIAELEGENARLRAALAQSDQPCAYCTLSKEDWLKCKSGFPGCARADDAMGCPELGARLEVEAAIGRVDKLEAEVKQWKSATLKAEFDWGEADKMVNAAEAREKALREALQKTAIQAYGSGVVGRWWCKICSSQSNEAAEKIVHKSECLLVATEAPDA